MDRLRAIDYFIKVADLGSFTAAARATGVPASSISRRIQDLEADLGATLLHRTTRIVRLTELGTLYLDHVRPAVTALDHAGDLITDRPSLPSGLLRITATPGYGRFLLLPAIRKLRRKYPGLIVDVELTDELSNLAGAEADIAVRATATPPERAIARKLTDNDFTLVASGGYLMKYGTPGVFGDLREHRTILYRSPERIAFWQARTEQGWEEVQTSPAFVCNDGREMVSEAVEGIGLALLPRWGIEAELEAGLLKMIELEDAELALSRTESSGVYLLYHQPKYRLVKIKAAVDFLIGELQRPEKK